MVQGRYSRDMSQAKVRSTDYMAFLIATPRNVSALEAATHLFEVVSGKVCSRSDEATVLYDRGEVEKARIYWQRLSLPD